MSEFDYSIPYPCTSTLYKIADEKINELVDIKRLAALSYNVQSSEVLSEITSRDELIAFKNNLALIRYYAIVEIMNLLESGILTDFDKKVRKNSNSFLGHQKISIIVKKAKKITSDRIKGGKDSEDKDKSTFKDKAFILSYYEPYSLIELKCMCLELGAQLPYGSLITSRAEALRVLVSLLSNYLYDRVNTHN